MRAHTVNRNTTAKDKYSWTGKEGMALMAESINSGRTRKIYCANCIHCKLVRAYTEEDKYVLRVRCNEGKWRKKLGGEKFYKYFTIANRSQNSCDTYTPMGESKPFMRELRANLPVKDEVYEVLAPST